MWGRFFASHAWEFAPLALLLTASAFFSGTETALFSLTFGQRRKLGRSHGPLGRMIALLTRRPRRVLNTLLLGNMIVNVAFASFSAALLLALKAEGAAAWAVAVASLAPLLTLILVGEVTPKMFAYATAERWVTIAAGPVYFIGRGLWPILWLLETVLVTPLTRIVAPRSSSEVDVTTEELGALLVLSAKRGLIDRGTSELLREIVQLGDLRVGEIMVPRVDVVSYDIDAPSAGLAELFRRTHLRKIPVYEGDMDRIVGVVHAKRLLLEPGAALRDLVVKVPFLPEAASVERALLQFRVRGRQLAIVVDEYGGTAGLVTLEDILEEIVGDIAEPHDAPAGPAVQRISDREYLLDADLAIHEWSDAFGMDISGRRVSTIGGFATSLLGHLPHVGEVVTYRNLRFTVESMRRRRVGRLRLELTEARP